MQNAHIASCRGTDFEYDPNCGTYLEAGDRWVGCRDWSERHIHTCVIMRLFLLVSLSMCKDVCIYIQCIQREIENIETRLHIQKIPVLIIHRISTERCFVQLLSCTFGHIGPHVSPWIDQLAGTAEPLGVTVTVSRGTTPELPRSSIDASCWFTVNGSCWLLC